MAYTNPIQAKFELMVMMMGGMEEMGADEGTLKWIQYMMVQCFARDVLKEFKCYGYAEAYSWNVIGMKMDMIEAGTYNESSFIPLFPDFSNNARLPEVDELMGLWKSALENEYDLPAE